MKITNPEHIYFNEPVKVMQYLDDEKVELFIENPDIEVIIIASLNDISNESEALLPQSRKEFYEYIQKTTTSRVHIEATLKQLIAKNKIICKTISEDGLVNLIRNNDLDKTQLIEEFRSLRDQDFFDFNLTNAIYTTSSDFKKRNYKKNQY